MRTHAKASSIAVALSALLAAGIASLALAAPAGATLSVSGFFGSTAPFAGCGCLAGEIDGPRGIAVNSTGNGAPAGTMYIAEGREDTGSNNRISQYDPLGNFVRAWGADVVQSGPHQSDAVQSVRVDATGGFFKLTFKGDPTADISATAPAATVESALNAIPSINAGGGSVSVDGGPGNAGGTTPYLVNFDGGPLHGVEQPDMAGGNGSNPLTGGAATVDVVTTNPGETGFEICQAGSGDVCKEGVAPGNSGTAGVLGAAVQGPQSIERSRGPEGISIDQSTGDIYVTNQARLRIEVFSASGGFLRAFGNDVVASGPGNNGGLEVCTIVDRCQTATPGSAAAAFGTTAGFLSRFPGRLAVSPVGAPNAGNVVVADPTNLRVQEFTSSGSFVRAFGFDVAAGGPGDTGTGFEVCQPSGGDTCKAGTSGNGIGQFSTAFRRLAVDGTGAVYTVEEGIRVQKFVPQAGPVSLSPELIGGNETQSLTINASSGQFRLVFGTRSGATSGTGTFTNGSNKVTNVVTSTGKFTVGQELRDTGSGLSTFKSSDQALITAVEPGSLTVSIPAVATEVNKAISSELPYSTSDLAAGSTAGQIEAALNALPSINDSGSGTGDLKAGEAQVKNVVASGVFTPGREITGAGIPPGTTISFFQESTSTIFLSKAATVTATGVALTVPPKNPGTVAVSDGPPDGEGHPTFLATFSGPRFERQNPAPTGFTQGATSLSGGTGPTANQVVTSTPTPGGPNGTGTGDGPFDVAIGANDHVFIAKSFRLGDTPVCPDGTPGGADQHIQELTPSGTTVNDGHGACNGIHPSNIAEKVTPVSGLAVDPITGFVYETRGPIGSFPNERPNNVYTLAPGGQPTGSLDSLEETPFGAVIEGTVTPNATSEGVPGVVATLYRIEYRLVGSPDWTTYGGNSGAGSGFDPLPISVSLDGLDPNRDYEVRMVVTKPFHQGLAITPPKQFHTLPAPPRIEAFSSSEVSERSARLHATINPFGQDTTYRFEYGPTLAYGSSAPIPSGEISAGSAAVKVTTDLANLNGGVYHFRVVAENDAGTSTTGDQTFSFYPPSCPNESLRQQTGASYLPDCRAYELITPPRLGAVVLDLRAPVATDALSPTRFAYAGLLGSVRDAGIPTSNTQDVYIATRTASGWETKYTGLSASETLDHGGPLPPEGGGGGQAVGPGRASLTLDRFLDWSHGQVTSDCCGKLGSHSPTLFDYTGQKLGRLPTNFASVPGSTVDVANGGYTGAARPSPDFSHYVFSTADLAFAPGGRTVSPGSVYDNDLDDGSVTIVSRTAGGDIPPGTGGPNEVIRIPAVSTDGSHILMSTKASSAANPLGVHLYMSVDGTLAEDVSLGMDGLNHGVNYHGMTDGGEKVYFSSAERLTADDHDSGTDLFLWRSESPDSLTRVAGAAGTSDTDKCSASWITRCGVEVVTPKPPEEIPIGEYTDNVIAPMSGDIYFFSPEQLVPGKGIPDQRNLYVFRGGTVRFVAAFSVGARIERIQVTSSGSHMAMITDQKLTTYDNGGFEMMYLFDASSGQIRCASCRPDGSPPSRNVEGSLNGIFLTDDGRPFFTTGDPLVDRDINEKLRDVYEFVENRPQLITPGSSARDLWGGVPLGLVGVSRDGINVYISTLDSLVGQDLNGPRLKFYDARTGGGFPFKPDATPCQAADECHGPSSLPPAPIPSGTGVPLGSGGNSTKVRKAKKRRKKAKKRHQRASKQRGNRSTKGGTQR